MNLLHQELRHATIYPEKHDQSVWFKQIDGVAGAEPACGTFGCLAGNTILHSGEKLDWRFMPEDTETWGYDYLTPDEVKELPETVEGHWTAEHTASGESAFDRGRELLGLTRHQADKLFEGDNTLDILWELAEEMTLGEISSWDYETAKRDAAAARLNEAHKALDDYFKAVKEGKRPASQDTEERYNFEISRLTDKFRALGGRHWMLGA